MACQNVIVCHPNNPGSKLFHNDITTNPRRKTKAAMPIGARMAQIAQNPQPLSLPQQIIILSFYCYYS
jgi:hypothetical protein